MASPTITASPWARSTTIPGCDRRIGDCSRLLRPLVEALGQYVIGAQKLHADDTPVPVLEPGRGKTRTGRLWTYVRDDRPSGSTDPPAVLFRY